jgi:AraC-like DNA-binding protein
VHAIARRWGFDDAAHFSKIFKACYGEPPGAYRRGGPPPLGAEWRSGGAGGRPPG